MYFWTAFAFLDSDFHIWCCCSNQNWVACGKNSAFWLNESILEIYSRAQSRYLSEKLKHLKEAFQENEHYTYEGNTWTTSMKPNRLGLYRIAIPKRYYWPLWPSSVLLDALSKRAFPYRTKYPNHNIEIRKYLATGPLETSPVAEHAFQGDHTSYINKFDDAVVILTTSNHYSRPIMLT